MSTPLQPVQINGQVFVSNGEVVYPYQGMTAAKAAALVSKEVG
jgi:hypothetical protein